MLTFCYLVLLSPDRLCVEVNFIFPVVAESGHIVLIILFINHDEHIFQPFNPFSAGPDTSRVKKMSRYNLFSTSLELICLKKIE